MTLMALFGSGAGFVRPFLLARLFWHAAPFLVT
jgi:hypothetical protein